MTQKDIINKVLKNVKFQFTVQYDLYGTIGKKTGKKYTYTYCYNSLYREFNKSMEAVGFMYLSNIINDNTYETLRNQIDNLCFNIKLDMIAKYPELIEE